MRNTIVALTLTLALFGGCATGPTQLGVADVHGPLEWGSADNVMQVSRLYFSAQPDAEGLRAARDGGVTAVINLRPQDEMEFDEAGAARAAGLVYYQVPVSGSGESFDRAAFARIGELVRAHPNEAMLLHCSSGNRAAAWLAAHLVDDHGLSPAAALPVARRAGLTRPEVEQRTLRYLEEARRP